eukprot:TRINITY_DN761_c0_g1_i2.p1 TRINITY_DN761_c0_g1~~TRINITY_DN761_c0_g1_i2.p1  ORF type:complete len:194 (+),score=37.19 TRINITY_DN761_c0_g1_i2:73-654(+)
MGRDLKITVVGSTAVGKTSLLISYTTNSFPGDHVPTVFDNYSCNALIDNEAITLGLWDTAGSNDYDELRPLSFPGTDAFLVCFSVTDLDSLTAVESKWVPEIKQHGDPDSPIILVATKSDLRASNPDNVSEDRGKEMAKKIQAYKYIECSARTQDNLQEVFQETIRAVIRPKSDESDDKTKKKKKGLFGFKKK